MSGRCAADDNWKSRKDSDAMKLGLSNFQPVAASEIIEQEVLDLGDVEQFTAPMIESDRDLASLIREVGLTSIRDVDQLVGELEEARDYLKSEEKRIRAATARYTALTQAASASVKVIFDAVREWRKPRHSLRAASWGNEDAVEDTSETDALNRMFSALSRSISERWPSSYSLV